MSGKQSILCLVIQSTVANPTDSVDAHAIAEIRDAIMSIQPLLSVHGVHADLRAMVINHERQAYVIPLQPVNHQTRIDESLTKAIAECLAVLVYVLENPQALVEQYAESRANPRLTRAPRKLLSNACCVAKAIGAGNELPISLESETGNTTLTLAPGQPAVYDEASKRLKLPRPSESGIICRRAMRARLQGDLVLTDESDLAVADRRSVVEALESGVPHSFYAVKSPVKILVYRLLGVAPEESPSEPSQETLDLPPTE